MRRPIFFGHCSSGSESPFTFETDEDFLPLKKEKTRFLQSGLILLEDLATQLIKNLPVNAGDVRDTGLIPGQKDPLEKEKATHSSILAWKISWMEPGRLQSMGSQIVGHNWATSHHFRRNKKESIYNEKCNK